MSRFNISIDHNSSIPKFQQLIDCINNGISQNLLKTGDVLPSVNTICNDTGLARATIVKAFDELKKRGVIESIPNKGYYIAKENLKVLLLLDTLRPFKQVIYDNFRDNLPENSEVNMYFHHYNINLLNDIIDSTRGKYSYYIIMCFDHPKIKEIIKKVDSNKLLVFDWWNPEDMEYSYLIQNFDQQFKVILENSLNQIKKYKEINFICHDTANHPREATIAFSEFCKANKIPGKHLEKLPKEIKDKAFIVIDDKHLIKLIKQIRSEKLKVGKDIGLISYNDYPMKEVLEGGINVISSDFSGMAREMASVVIDHKKTNTIVQSFMIDRGSL